jgi:hypothetical protein
MTQLAQLKTIDAAAYAWWRWLEHNRGERAGLRRCTDPLDVMLREGFFDLGRRLQEGGETGLVDRNPERVAAGAVLIARLPRPDTQDQVSKAESEWSASGIHEKVIEKFQIKSPADLFTHLAQPRESEDNDSRVAADSSAVGTTPLLSRLRFTSLIRTDAESGAALIRNIGRALDILRPKSRTIHPGVVLQTVLSWDKDRFRRKLAAAYWTAVTDLEHRRGKTE